MYEAEKTIGPAKEPQVKQELSVLLKNADALWGLVNQLEDRLTPVLRPSTPKEAGRDGAEQGLVKVAEEIYTGSELTQRSINALRDILDRLEV